MKGREHKRYPMFISNGMFRVFLYRVVFPSLLHIIFYCGELLIVSVEYMAHTSWCVRQTSKQWHTTWHNLIVDFFDTFTSTSRQQQLKSILSCSKICVNSGWISSNATFYKTKSLPLLEWKDTLTKNHLYFDTKWMLIATETIVFFYLLPPDCKSISKLCQFIWNSKWNCLLFWVLSFKLLDHTNSVFTSEAMEFIIKLRASSKIEIKTSHLWHFTPI